MKYKEILTFFPNMSKLLRNRILLRFYRCTPEIKKEIKQYLETNVFPTYSTTIIMEGKEITLSVYTLVKNHNMKVLDAFLFIDDFLQPEANKEELLNSLVSLRVGEAAPQVDLDYLRENVDPEVKKQAELMSTKLSEQYKPSEQDIEIEEKEI